MANLIGMKSQSPRLRTGDPGRSVYETCQHPGPYRAQEAREISRLGLAAPRVQTNFFQGP